MLHDAYALAVAPVSENESKRLEVPLIITAKGSVAERVDYTLIL